MAVLALLPAYLINQVAIGGGASGPLVLRAGEKISDSATLALVLGAGGQVASTSDPIVSAAQLVVTKLRANGADERICNEMMIAALAASFGSGEGNAEFGDGSDGAVVFDGVATVLGLVPSTKAYTLTKDIFVKTAVVAAGAIIIGAGFRIFASVSLTNNGTIHNGGNPGLIGSAGAGGAAGGAVAAGSLGGGSAGGAGGSAGVGAAGAAQTANTGFPGGTGIGGVGGGDGTHLGGAAGTWSAMAAADGNFRTLSAAVNGWVISGAGTTFTLKGGSGGGGGASDNADGGGGGGGSGAGVMVIAAYLLINNGVIHCNGGLGGAGFSPGNNAGGGAGGGAGDLITVARTYLGTGTYSVAGGVGGAKVGAAGVAGLPGAVGTFLQLAA
jgi:hypothetical protein